MLIFKQAFEFTKKFMLLLLNEFSKMITQTTSQWEEKTCKTKKLEKNKNRMLKFPR